MNRIANNNIFYFELVDDERDEVADTESAQHEAIWLSANEVVKAKLQHAEFALMWQRVMTGMDAYTGDGFLVNSGVFDGRDNREALWDIVEAAGGERVTQYRIRDWLVSRQRYWGCPIPVVYDPEGNPHIVPAEYLPWTLPTDVDFTPTGKSPLASSKELHERVERIFGKGWTPEYDTLDVFVDSSWYYTRYLDPQDEHDFSDQSLMKKWLPINRYTGGAEHTTVHLLYARFFYKALYDMALVPTPEPFIERLNRGIILGTDGQKMSKSKGNVLNPDELVEKYGADTVRLYLAFIGPYNEPGSYPWNPAGVEAMRRFLDRVYRLAEKVEDSELSDDFNRALGKAAAKVASDIERFKFNTAISALMILVRDLEGFEKIPRQAYQELLVLLAPFAPHLSENLWNSSESIHQSVWPHQDMKAEEELATVIVQINSKKKGEIQLEKDASEEAAIALAKEIPAISEQFEKGTKRVIYVPGRILNILT